MSKFLTTSAAITEIEAIIKNASSTVVLISPYLKIPNNLFQTLQYADSMNKNIVIIYGKKRQLDNDVASSLGKLKNLKLRFLNNLHAKCYFNESHMVITSLNLYDYSQDNKEMGILLSRKDDTETFEQAIKEYCELTRNSKLVNVRTDRVKRGLSITARIVGQGIEALMADDSGSGASSNIKRTRKCKSCGKAISYERWKTKCPSCWRKAENKRG